MADLRASRDQLTAERDQAKAQLAAAQQELTTLQKRLEKAQEKGGGNEDRPCSHAVEQTYAVTNTDQAAEAMSR